MHKAILILAFFSIIVVSPLNKLDLVSSQSSGSQLLNDSPIGDFILKYEKAYGNDTPNKLIIQYNSFLNELKVNDPLTQKYEKRPVQEIEQKLFERIAVHIALDQNRKNECTNCNFQFQLKAFNNTYVTGWFSNRSVSDFSNSSGLPYFAYLMETIASSPSFESVDLYLREGTNILKIIAENSSSISSGNLVKGALNSIVTAQNHLSDLRHGYNHTSFVSQNDVNSNKEYCKQKLVDSNLKNQTTIYDALDILDEGEKLVLSHLNDTRNAVIENNITKAYNELYQSDVSFTLMLQCVGYYLP